MERAVIVDAVRTGLAKAGRGSFNITRPDTQVAHLVNAIMQRNSKVDPQEVEDVILGCGSPEGAQGQNIARTSAVLAGLPVTVGGVTINRYCSSGLQSVAMAASQIQSGGYEVMLAGGVESISMTAGKNNMSDLVNPELMEKVPGIYHPMGQTAECVAKRYNVTREAQDEYALLSQQRTARAQELGYFEDEIVPMKTRQLLVNKETGDSTEVDVVVDRDECNRPQTTLEGLASLKPVFDPENGSVTAGNSSQLSDGAALALVMSESKAEKLGLQPMLRFVGFTTVGCQPDEMGIGPVFSIPRLLERCGLTQDDIDVWELNEAFASQVVYIRDKLGLPEDKLNVNGGSISIGHPFGMTGARQIAHLGRELKRRNGKYGVVTMCVGGGQGATGIFENIS